MTYTREEFKAEFTKAFGDNMSITDKEGYLLSPITEHQDTYRSMVQSAGMKINPLVTDAIVLLSRVNLLAVCDDHHLSTEECIRSLGSIYPLATLSSAEMDMVATTVGAPYNGFSSSESTPALITMYHMSTNRSINGDGYFNDVLVP